MTLERTRGNSVELGGGTRPTAHGEGLALVWGSPPQHQTSTRQGGVTLYTFHMLSYISSLVGGEKKVTPIFKFNDK